MSEFTLHPDHRAAPIPDDHSGEQTLALILQLVARLDHMGIRGEVRLRIMTSGGPLEIVGKSAALLAEEQSKS